MNIHIVNEHSDMQANKLNAKYHFHVQYIIDARTLKQLYQGYKIQQGHKSTKENAKNELKVLSYISKGTYKVKYTT